MIKKDTTYLDLVKKQHPELAKGFDEHQKFWPDRFNKGLHLQAMKTKSEWSYRRKNKDLFFKDK